MVAMCCVVALCYLELFMFRRYGLFQCFLELSNALVKYPTEHYNKIYILTHSQCLFGEGTWAYSALH